MSVVAPSREDFIDLLDESRTQSPYAYFDAIRSATPVHWNARHRAWLVTAHAAVVEGFRDRRLISNQMRKLREKVPPELEGTVGRALGILESWMVFQDNPDHLRLRSVVQKAFTPASVQALLPMIKELARQQVAEVNRRLDQAPDQPIDILREIAYEIPGPVICEMLGVPAQDRNQFVAWTDELATVISGSVDDPARYARTHEAVEALEAYLNDRIARMPPGQDNLLARLTAAEADGQRLTRHEVISNAILILFGGNRTTSCMIANGVRALVLHPEQLERACGETGLLNATVEELLRWESHTKFAVRLAAEDFVWHGQQLRKGDRVFLSPLAANRDPMVFADPARFDVGRTNHGQSLVFGGGMHFCMGMSLARLELRTFFAEALPTIKRLRLVDPQSTWVPSIVSRVQRECKVVQR